MPVPIKAFYGTQEIIKRYVGNVLVFDNTGDVWLLATGSWDDAGIWDDAETWNDTAGAGLISRVQFADNAGAPFGSTLTWDTTPVAGNLLRVIAMERSGNSHTTFSIDGTGWTKRIAMDTQLGVTTARRTLVIWDKIAGASEPTTVTVSGAAAVVGEEYNDTLGGTWAFKESSEDDTGTGTTSPLSTGTTASVANGELLVASLAGWRVEGTDWVDGSSSWTNNDANTVESAPTGSNEIAFSATFGYITTGGTFENEVSWQGSGHEGNATIAIYEAE